MGRRSNSGYIGYNSEDTVSGGMLDREKNYRLRQLYDIDEYQMIVNLYSGERLGNQSAYDWIIPSSSVGSGSTATVGLVSGSIATLIFYAGGTGYTSAPTLSFSGGGGTGADGYVSTVAAGAITAVERLGTITNYTITNGGLGYTSAPTVTVSAPGVTANGRTGVTAIVSASITNGVVTSLTIHNTGSHYRGLGNYPTFTFSGGGSPTVTAQALPILEFGRNYTSAPTVTVSGGGGSSGVVSASIYGMLPATASVTNGGGGYVYAPSVAIDGVYKFDTSASATLTGNSVSSISIVTGSSRFSTPPTISVSGLPDIPAVNNNEVYLLTAVYNNDSNFNSFAITTNGGGGYTVDWGDGTTNNYSSGVAANKQYTTASYAAITSSVHDGYKFTLIKATLSGSATSFATVDFRNRPTLPTGSYSNGVATNNYIAIKMAGSEITSCLVGSNSTTLLACSMLEYFEFSGSNKITSAFASMFSNCYNLVEVKSLFTASGSAFNGMFVTCPNLIRIPPIDFAGGGSVNIQSMFQGCSKIETIVFLNNGNKINSINAAFNGCYQLKKIVAQNNRLGGSNIGSWGQPFFACYSLEYLPELDLSGVNSNIDGLFQELRTIKTIRLVGSTSRITSMANLFNGCYALEEIIGTIDARTCTSFDSMFNACRSLRKLPNIVNTRLVTTLSSTFNGCASLKRVPLFDTQNVTTFANTFNGCQALATIPRYNTSKVTTFNQTFSGCNSLMYIPPIDTSNANTFASMFINCFALRNVPQLNTTKGTNFSSMFSGCASLKSIPYIDTQNATTAASMFASCTSLKEVPLLNFANVTDMNNTFSNCLSLSYVPLFNTSNVTNISSMFSGCTALKEIPSFNFAKATTRTQPFNQCLGLKRIGALDLRSGLTANDNLFSNLQNLVEVGPIQFSSNSTISYANAFLSCRSLRRIQMLNVANNISVASCLLSANELNEIYTNLATVGAAGSNAKTITVTGNWGTPADNPSIATNKGWQVTS